MKSRNSLDPVIIDIQYSLISTFNFDEITEFENSCYQNSDKSILKSTKFYQISITIILNSVKLLGDQ